MEVWVQQLRVVRVQQSVLRTVDGAKLKGVLPTLFTSLGVASRAEKIDVRQPAAHALARLAAAMAEPDKEAVAEVEKIIQPTLAEMVALEAEAVMSAAARAEATVVVAMVEVATVAEETAEEATVASTVAEATVAEAMRRRRCRAS